MYTTGQKCNHRGIVTHFLVRDPQGITIALYPADEPGASWRARAYKNQLNGDTAKRDRCILFMNQAIAAMKEVNA